MSRYIEATKFDFTHSAMVKRHKAILKRKGNAVPASKCLTTNQVAERFNTSSQLIRASRTTGVLFGLPSPKFIKFGNAKILYRLEDIEAYEKQGKVQRITV